MLMQLQRWDLEQLNPTSCVQFYISISDGLPQMFRFLSRIQV